MDKNMDWKEDYKRKLISAEDAVKVVKSGDKVLAGVCLGAEPRALFPALMARRNELRGVKMVIQAPSIPMEWYGAGWEDSFTFAFLNYTGPIARPMMDEKRADYIPFIMSFQPRRWNEGALKDSDVYLVVMSPPDKNGFCSFGAHLWNKKTFCRNAKIVLAEVNENLIRTGGDNFINVSEVDYFVENTPPKLSGAEVDRLVTKAHPDLRERIRLILKEADPEQRPALADGLLKLKPEEFEGVGRFFAVSEMPGEVEKRIAEYLSGLVHDGDTICIGFGNPGGSVIRLGAFDNKIDLGYHGEMATRGLAKLVEGGVITGKHKALHPGKAVVSAWLGLWEDEMAYVDGNPRFESYETSYMIDIKTLLNFDNFVAINNCLSVDLTGQINSESVLGPRLMNGMGGQPELATGAVLSKGGRSIHCLPSTALGGAVSRIVPLMEEGSLVTIPRYFADHVVTEYGVARLFGKSIRQRAEELIAIAHPDFRGELRAQAKKLFYS